jgi:hypothetical protein
MTFLARLRRRLAELLLRGPLLEWWVDRKIRRLESEYTTELVRHSKGPPAHPAPRLKQLKRQPRRILFISDFQWEGKELVPELQKICPVDSLNLHEALTSASNATSSPPEVVNCTLSHYLAKASGPEPDVILFYARPALLSEEAFHLFRRRYSCPVLGLQLDDKVQFLPYRLFSEGNDDYQRWAKHLDLNITNVRAVVDWYSDRGLPVSYMAEGYHPKTEPLSPEPAYAHELSFVGSWRAERALLYHQLKSRGVPIEMFGFGWPNSEEGKHPENIYRSSMMTLGIGFASPSKTLTTLKTRDFECPGSGACYLTTYNWELALHYEIGREILCYRSVEEIVELFSYYRRRPLECWKIAQAAYRRCLSEHTWQRRFEKLFEDNGL